MEQSQPLPKPTKEKPVKEKKPRKRKEKPEEPRFRISHEPVVVIFN